VGRLVDLDAFWIAPYGPDRAMGVSWLCPRHVRCHVFAWFKNPRGGQSPVESLPGEVELYTRVGESLEALTLMEPILSRCGSWVLLDGWLLEH
jgi:hypothetical protein